MNPLRQKIASKLDLAGFTIAEREEILTMAENLSKEKIFVGIMEGLTMDERMELEQMTETEYASKLSRFLEPKFVQFRKVIDSCSDEVVEEFNSLRK